METKDSSFQRLLELVLGSLTDCQDGEAISKLMRGVQNAQIHLHMDGQVTVGTSVKVEKGATYIKNNLPNGKLCSDREDEQQDSTLAQQGKKGGNKVWNDDALRNMINMVMPRITVNRQWFCIAKVLMLRGLVPYDDFEEAKKLLDGLFPSGYPHAFDSSDLKKMHVGSFRFPVDKWDITDCPFKRQAEFRSYSNLAAEFYSMFDL